MLKTPFELEGIPTLSEHSIFKYMYYLDTQPKPDILLNRTSIIMFTLGVDDNADPGTPMGVPQQVGSVFKRRYTKASVALDCSTFNATIDFS